MSEYEFSVEQNMKFETLAQLMTLVGSLAIISGVLSIIITLQTSVNFFFIFASSGMILFGFTFLLPVSNILKIVNTSGKDIHELRLAFKELNRGWSLFLILVFLGILNNLIELTNNLL